MYFSAFEGRRNIYGPVRIHTYAKFKTLSFVFGRDRELSPELSPLAVKLEHGKCSARVRPCESYIIGIFPVPLNGSGMNYMDHHANICTISVVVVCRFFVFVLGRLLSPLPLSFDYLEK
jgi:hypothetical protein